VNDGAYCCDASHVGHWAKGNVDAFTAMFCPHCDASPVDEVLVPCCSDIDSGGAGAG